MSIDPKAKLKIISLDSEVTVEAQFNPKEVKVEKQVPWQKQKKKGPSDLEYTGGEPRKMSFELMFDGFESGTSVEGEIAKLHSLTDATISQDAKNEQKKRPPKVAVIWGTGTNSQGGGIPRFEAVVASVNVTYTMFLPSGEAVRATAQVALTEARDLKVGKKQ